MPDLNLAPIRIRTRGPSTTWSKNLLISSTAKKTAPKKRQPKFNNKTSKKIVHLACQRLLLHTGMYSTRKDDVVRSTVMLTPLHGIRELRGNFPPNTVVQL